MLDTESEGKKISLASLGFAREAFYFGSAKWCILSL